MGGSEPFNIEKMAEGIANAVLGVDHGAVATPRAIEAARNALAYLTRNFTTLELGPEPWGATPWVADIEWRGEG